MCGRFTLTNDRDQLQQNFPIFQFFDQHSPRFNIAPSQQILAVTNSGEMRSEFLQWGLIPSWSKDPKIGSRMINARSETLAEKPSFRTPFRKRRCLIFADGFYEWTKNLDGSKTPIFIRKRSQKPFTFAGLWEIWKPNSDHEPNKTCTIITTQANNFASQFHHRMPVIVGENDHDRWLDPNDRRAENFADLFAPHDRDDLTAYPVSRFVNSPKNDSPICIEPASDQPLLFSQKPF